MTTPTHPAASAEVAELVRRFDRGEASVADLIALAIHNVRDASASLPPSAGKYASDFPSKEALHDRGWHASACTDRAESYLVRALALLRPPSPPEPEHALISVPHGHPDGSVMETEVANLATICPDCEGYRHNKGGRGNRGWCPTCCNADGSPKGPGPGLVEPEPGAGDLEAMARILGALRTWDMLNPADGTPEPLADGPWAREQLDEAVALIRRVSVRAAAPAQPREDDVAAIVRWLRHGKPRLMKLAAEIERGDWRPPAPAGDGDGEKE